MTQDDHPDFFNHLLVYFYKIIGVFGDIIFHTQVLPAQVLSGVCRVVTYLANNMMQCAY